MSTLQEELIELMKTPERFKQKLMDNRNNISRQVLNDLFRTSCFQERLEILKFLISMGIKFSEHKSLLLKLSEIGKERIVKYLVIRGFSVDYENEQGQNCGHLAYLHGNIRLGNWFMYKTNLKISKKDSIGRNVLDCRNISLARSKENHTSNVMIINTNEDIPCGSGLNGAKYLLSKKVKSR